MRNRRKINFMTLVVAIFLLSTHVAHAAIADPQPNIDDKTSEEELSKKAPPEVLNTIDITPVAKKNHFARGDLVSSEYFYSFRSEISARMGAVYNVDAIK